MDGYRYLQPDNATRSTGVVNVESIPLLPNPTNERQHTTLNT